MSQRAPLTRPTSAPVRDEDTTAATAVVDLPHEWAGSVAWVAKGNKIIFGLVYLCPSAASCVRERLVRPTTRELQELHVVPDVPHDV